MLQIYRRAPIPNRDFNKVAKQQVKENNNAEIR